MSTVQTDIMQWTDSDTNILTASGRVANRERYKICNMMTIMLVCVYIERHVSMNFLNITD